MLAGEDLGPLALVEELHYGALAVAQRLEELCPEGLILVGAIPRGLPPGTVTRRRVRDLHLSPAEVQLAMNDAGTGYVTIDLLVEVCAGLGRLPERTVAIEVEPADDRVNGRLAERLSPLAQAALPEVLELVRAEVRRTPLLSLATVLRGLVEGDRLEEVPAVVTLRALLDELRTLDDDGRWGTTFALRDRLRLQIAEGLTGEGMDHVDWGLWWALIEEIDRLQPLESQV